MGFHASSPGGSGSNGDPYFSLNDSEQRFDRKLIEPFLRPLLVYPHLERSRIEVILCIQDGNPVKRSIEIQDRNEGKRIGGRRAAAYLPLVDQTFLACGMAPLKHFRIIYQVENLRLVGVLVQVCFLPISLGGDAGGAGEGRR